MSSEEQRLTVFRRAFSHLFGLQLIPRLSTFLLNLAVARQLSPSVYGLAATRLPLFNTSLLLLSREAFRRSCLRKATHPGASKDEELRLIWPLALKPIKFGLLLGTCAFFVYLFVHSAEDVTIPWSLLGEHGLAIVLELMSEPFYIVAALWLEFRLRTWVEGSAVLAKSLWTFLAATFTERDQALAIADGHVVYALILLIGYATLWPRIRSILSAEQDPSRKRQVPFDRMKQRLWRVFFIQTVEKLVLGEGSKYVLMFYTTVYDEGVFGLISNLGSLVVRIIFQPFEEAAFTTFSRTGVSQSASDMAKMRDMLSVMIRGICIVGFLPVVFGPPSSSLFLRLLYSQRWSETEAPVVLAYYCPYIALMALNGICEAFVHAVLDVKDLKVSNVFMMISAGFHVVVSITFIRYAGAVGLVLADSLNMLGRIIFALWCIRRHFRSKGDFSLRALFPHGSTLLSGLLVSAALFVCKQFAENISRFETQIAVYASLSCALLLLFGWVLWKTERGVWNELLALRRDQGDDKKDR